MTRYKEVLKIQGKFDSFRIFSSLFSLLTKTIRNCKKRFGRLFYKFKFFRMRENQSLEPLSPPLLLHFSYLKTQSNRSFCIKFYLYPGPRKRSQARDLASLNIGNDWQLLHKIKWACNSTNFQSFLLPFFLRKPNK